MSQASFIAGDWGTSNLRMSLCTAAGEVLDSRAGPGAAQSRGEFARVFDGLTGEWRARHGALPALLCGMAGSSFGWREAPYLLCPEGLDDLVDSLAAARPDVHIVPGMRCMNALGAPDVMRGEETQLLGALTLAPGLARGRQLVCMPGTHTKWVSLHDGVVLDFLTVPTGEIYRMLCDHSVLVRDADTGVAHLPAEFTAGLAEARRHAGVSLLLKLFQARSLRIDKQLTAAGAPAWMSGLLVGTDVDGALPLFATQDSDTPVYLIGTDELGALYEQALAGHARKCMRVSGEAASLAGLTSIHQARTAA